MRGLEGQKIRGYSAGENVYGYYTKPSGKLRVNKKGQHKYDGMVHKINPGELYTFQSHSPAVRTYEMLKMWWSYCTYQR